MSIKGKSLKLNAFLNMVRTFMGLLFPLITFPYVSRILGPVNIGKINFSQSIINYFVMFAMLGVSNYGIREASKVRDDKKRLSKFVKEILILNLISSLIAYIALFFVVTFVKSLSNYKNLIFIFSTSILFTVIGVDWLFYALEDLVSVTFRSCIFQVLSLACLFLFVRKSDDYMNYAVICVISSVGSNIFSLFVSVRFVDYRTKVKLELKKHLKPIMIFFFMTIAMTVNSSIDITMLGFISGDKQVGLYSVATRIVRIVTAVATATTVILPRLSYCYAQHKIVEMKEVIANTLYTNICFVLPAIVGLFIISKPIILILSGNEYIDSISILRVLSPTVLFIALSNLTGSHLFMAIGKEKYVIYSIFSGILLNIALNFFFIPIFGGFGAGIATCLTEFSVCFIQLLLVRKFFSVLSLKPFCQFLIATLLMGILVFYLQKIKISYSYSASISIICGAFIYFLILLVMKNETVCKILKWRKK